MSYDNLHLFLDESGDPTNTNERIFVGGVLILGDYSERDDSALKDLLRDAVHNLRGQYPNDLHFGDSSFGHPEFARLFNALRTKIQKWSGKARKISGVLIEHRTDIFPYANPLIGEFHRDNRYLAMVWRLIEHLIFVDGAIAEQVSDGKLTVNLTIANRAFRFHVRDLDPKIFQRWGINYFQSYEDSDTMIVPQTLTAREVQNMMRCAIQDRWRKSNVALGTVIVPSIAYGSDTSTPAGLYLADLYVSSRAREIRYPHRRPLPPLIDDFKQITFGPWLESLARMRSLAGSSNLREYFHAASDYQSDSSSEVLNTYSNVLDRAQAVAAEEFSTEDFTQCLTEACMVLDQPGQISLGEAQLAIAQDLAARANIKSLHTDLLSCQAGLTLANHQGNVEEAERQWQRFKSYESQLQSLGAEGLELKANICNRRAINLMDQFQVGEAKEILRHVASDSLGFLRSLAELYGVKTRELPLDVLGKCHGSLGQAYAFRATAESQRKAEQCFCRAISYFQSPAMSERQYVYLGHLACDLGAAGRELWESIMEHLPKLSLDKPDFTAGDQYIFALALKGLLVFGTDHQLLAFLDENEFDNLVSNFSVGERAAHPFGLILQAMGLLWARHWRMLQQPQSSHTATAFFLRAAKLMAHGSVFLQLLSRIATLRGLSFACESDSTPANHAMLSDCLAGTEAFLREHFPAHPWNHRSPVQEPTSFGAHDLVSSFVFNYW